MTHLDPEAEARLAAESPAYAQFASERTALASWMATAKLPPELLSIIEEMKKGAAAPVLPACHRWPVPTAALPDLSDPYAAVTYWQDGCCAICGSRRGGVVHDHDHYTGLKRGDLCHGCNTREGLREVGDEMIQRYRERPPAAMLGVSEPYLHPFTGKAPELREPPFQPDFENNCLNGIGL